MKMKKRGQKNWKTYFQIAETEMQKHQSSEHIFSQPMKDEKIQS